MSDLFDRLQNEMDDRNEEGGISPMDLLELPDEMRKIMRQMLRAGTMSRIKITELVDSWPEEERLQSDDLDKSLKSLVTQGWLIEMGEGEYLGYRVNLRRKKGSTLTSSIWGALDERLTDRKEQKTQQEEDPDDDE
jgi:hypothetical protein